MANDLMDKVDVVIAGGGMAGIMAAIAAARQGKKVALIESGPFFGGIASNGPLEALMTFHDQDGQVVQGLPAEFVQRMQSAGYSPGHETDTVGYAATITPYDAEGLKYTAVSMLLENKVIPCLNTMVTGAEVENGTIRRVITESVSGKKAIKASAFVDCTGDGILALAAGNPVHRGRDADGKTQPVSLLVRVNEVDTDALRDYVAANRDDFMFADDADLSARYLHLWGFGNVLERGAVNGKLSLKRKEIHAMLTPAPGEIILNYSRVQADPYDTIAMSLAYCTALKQVHELVAWFVEAIPAFANARIVQTGKIGVRESGRIEGKYTLTIDDVVNPKPFPRIAAMGAFPVDIHQPDGDSMQYRRIVKAYAIPMECLEASRIGNLFMAGRCISATHEAIGSARIAVTCMATGEAAGKLAAAAAG